VLKVTVPKPAPAQVKKIEVKAAAMVRQYDLDQS
jgi:hypothetical protein